MSDANFVSDAEKAEHLGYAGGKGVKRVSVFNDGVQVNIATAEKQDDIIAAINNISGISSSEVIQLFYAANPGQTFTIAGPKVTGSTPPIQSSITQARIAFYVSLGIPEENIYWSVVGEVDESAFVIADITSSSSIEDIVLTQIGGTFVINNELSDTTVENIDLTFNGSEFVIADLTSVSEIENITLTSENTFAVDNLYVGSNIDNIELEQAGGGNFEVANEISDTNIDNVGLIQASGELSIADETSDTSIENIDIVQNGGTLSVADETSSSNEDNVVLTQAGGTLAIADEASSSTVDNITLAVAGASLPVNEAFGTNLGVFSTLYGTPTVSGGNLVLNSNNEGVYVNVNSFARGFRITTGVAIPAALNDGGFCLFYNDIVNSSGNGYRMTLYSTSEYWEDEGDSGYENWYHLRAGRLYNNGADEEILNYYDALGTSDTTFIFEVQSGGTILIKENGVTRVTTSNNTYTSGFVKFRIQSDSSGTAPTWNVHDVLLDTIA